MTHAHSWRSATSALEAGARTAPTMPRLPGLPTLVRLVTRRKKPHNPIVKIASSPSRLEGEMWAEALRRRGIPCVLKSHAYGAIPSGLEGALLFVLESQADEALEVLEIVGLRPEDRLR